jgi:rod shape-determining protein MreC
MLGRVIEVGEKAARVLLLTDINSRVPVLIEGSNQKAILSGNNGDYLSLKHLPADSSLSEGGRIVTSGDGGIFPAGLPIGRVALNDNGKFIVKPYADLSRVSYVRIIKVPIDKNLIRGDISPSHE